MPVAVAVNGVAVAKPIWQLAIEASDSVVFN